MRLISAVSGVQIPPPPPLSSLSRDRDISLIFDAGIFIPWNHPMPRTARAVTAGFPYHVVQWDSNLATV